MRNRAMLSVIPNAKNGAVYAILHRQPLRSWASSAQVFLFAQTISWKQHPVPFVHRNFDGNIYRRNESTLNTRYYHRKRFKSEFPYLLAFFQFGYDLPMSRLYKDIRMNVGAPDWVTIIMMGGRDSLGAQFRIVSEPMNKYLEAKKKNSSRKIRRWWRTRLMTGGGYTENKAGWRECRP